MNLHNTQKKQNSQSNIGIFSFWKFPGETLAVMLRRFRAENRIADTEKITYAGRLDPMAEGLVPLLVGEARFQKERLLKKAKTYEVEVLLGISTDTGDMLGIVTDKDFILKQGVKRIAEAIETMKNIKELPYPHYSSRPVDGKPLFMHARAGKKVMIPIKKVVIHDLELVEVKEAPLKEVLDTSLGIIKKVQGDFRQKEIIEQWISIQETDSDFAKTTTDTGGSQITIVTIRTTVSSGTYMRSLAEKMGELLGVPALAYTIKRINIDK